MDDAICVMCPAFSQRAVCSDLFSFEPELSAKPPPKLPCIQDQDKLSVKQKTATISFGGFAALHSKQRIYILREAIPQIIYIVISCQLIIYHEPKEFEFSYTCNLRPIKCYGI